MLVKDMMAQAHESLAELAAKLREALPNANLADVVDHAASKCKQAGEHPDAEHAVEAIHQAAERGEKIEHPKAAGLSGKPADEPQPAPQFEPGQQFPGQDPSQFGSG